MKYELVETDTINVGGVTLYRIKALKSFGFVKEGELGGYIKCVDNLSVYGNAWVYGDAWVYGNAHVFGNAQVYGNACVSDNACVYGDARVYGNTWVYGDAWVYGNAHVFGNAQVYGDTRMYGNTWVYGDASVSDKKTWLLVGPAKSSGRFTTAFVDSKIGVRVVCGCFTGTVAEFSEQIEKTHKDNPEYLEQYRLFCQLISYSFGVEE